MISTGESEKVKEQNELDQALKECEKYLSYFIQQHNKIHQLIHHSENPYYDEYLKLSKRELEVIRVESRRRAKTAKNNKYYAWVKEKNAIISMKTKFFASAFNNVGKFISKHNIDPPVARSTPVPLPMPLASAESSLLSLDMSQINSSGRPSIGVPSNVFEDNEGLEDFLNRSGRVLSSRCKLGNSSLDTSSPEDVEGQHIKENFVNERFLTPSTVKLSKEVPYSNVAHDSSLSGLDSSEAELLEDVVAPDITLNFTMSGALNAYEDKLAKEREAWLKYIDDIQRPEYRLSLVYNRRALTTLQMEQCIDIVWGLKMKTGYISEEASLAWKDHLEMFPAPKIFEENSDYQKLYNSEWIAMLGDVMSIGAKMFSKNENRQLSVEEEKPLFFNMCKKKIVDSCGTTRVEITSRQLDWDIEAHRKYAHNLILEGYD